MNGELQYYLTQQVHHAHFHGIYREAFLVWVDNGGRVRRDVSMCHAQKDLLVVQPARALYRF